MNEQERLQQASIMIQQALEQCGVMVNITMSARAYRGATYEDLGGAFLIRQGEGTVMVEAVGFDLAPIPDWQPPEQDKKTK